MRNRNLIFVLSLTLVVIYLGSCSKPEEIKKEQNVLLENAPIANNEDWLFAFENFAFEQAIQAESKLQSNARAEEDALSKYGKEFVSFKSYSTSATVKINGRALSLNLFNYPDYYQYIIVKAISKNINCALTYVKDNKLIQVGMGRTVKQGEATAFTFDISMLKGVAPDKNEINVAVGGKEENNYVATFEIGVYRKLKCDPLDFTIANSSACPLNNCVRYIECKVPSLEPKILNTLADKMKIINVTDISAGKAGYVGVCDAYTDGKDPGTTDYSGNGHVFYVVSVNANGTLNVTYGSSGGEVKSETPRPIDPYRYLIRRNQKFVYVKIKGFYNPCAKIN